MEGWGDESEPGWIDPAERAAQHPAGGDPTVPAGEAGEPTEYLPPGGGPPGGPPGPGGPGGPGAEDDEAARRKRLIWILAAAGAAAVIIAVLLVLLLTGGGGGKTASTTTSTSSTTTTTLPATTTHATTAPTTAAPVVSINSFNVPSTVTCSAPTQIAISWATNNATSVILSIDGAAYKTYSGPAGAESVPFACNGKTHTYTITAKNASSNATRSSTVTEVPATTTTT